MCGFFGFINLNRCNKSSSGILADAGYAIRHRGPDGSGIWHDDSVGIGLAHARLSIIDLSPAGYQPMSSTDDRYVITFNGEIYNHIDLRRKLGDQGRKFGWVGRSDTETLLACITAWGVESTLQSVVGMFAFALWDKKERVLTLARDRLGEKPLYWGWCDQALLFGSELKAFRAHPGFVGKVDRNSLAQLLRYNYIPSPFSIYEGIEKLAPGHYVKIKAGQSRAQVNPQPYWSLSEVVDAGIANPFSGDDMDAVKLLDSGISQAVSGQMLADVPLGAFLSGGVDSSTVVAFMQKDAHQPVKTFSIGFDEPGYNEAEYASQVANYLGTDHTELYVSSSDALELVPSLPETYCEPFADSSQLPTFLVSRMARQHVTVALSGDGGDELFGGYNYYQFAPPIWKKLNSLPLYLRICAAKVLSGFPLPRKISKLVTLFPVADQRVFYDLLVSHWERPELVLASEGSSFESSISKYRSASVHKKESFEELMMFFDAQRYMPDDILVKVDRAAMANSLETRVPLLDHRIVELAWQLPLNMKIRNGCGKWILRQVLYQYVQKDLMERSKKGFSVPLGFWLRGPLREWADALLNRQRLDSEGYFNADVVRHYWSQHLKGKTDYSLRLWSILMFQSWRERYAI